MSLVSTLIGFSQKGFDRKPGKLALVGPVLGWLVLGIVVLGLVPTVVAVFTEADVL